MGEISDYFEPVYAQEGTMSGTARQWYSQVLGSEFSCRCGEDFTTTEDHVGLWKTTDAPSKIKRSIADVADALGVDYNAYGVSDDTLEDGLYTDEGMLVQGFITCPYCLYQNGHHHDFVKAQFQIP